METNTMKRTMALVIAGAGLLMLAATGCKSTQTLSQTVVAAGAGQAPDLTPIALHPAAKHPPVPLARDGRPLAVVYVAEANPSASLALLVGELVEVLRLTTGAALEKVAEPPTPDQPAIIIGDCAEARAAGIDAEALPTEGFVVKTATNRVFLVGSTKALPAMDPHSLGGAPYANAGTAWAVADFLERFVGVRWYWPTDVGAAASSNSLRLRCRPCITQINRCSAVATSFRVTATEQTICVPSGGIASRTGCPPNCCRRRRTCWRCNRC